MLMKLRLSSKSTWSKAVVGGFVVVLVPRVGTHGPTLFLPLRSCSICSPQCGQKAEVNKLKEEVFLSAIILSGFSPWVFLGM